MKFEMANTHEWRYLLGIGSVMLLAILIGGSLVLNVYQVSLLAISSSRDLSAIHHAAADAGADLATPIAINVNDWHLFGSPPPVVSTILNGSLTLSGIEYIDSSNAAAIITNHAGEDGRYHVGDKVSQTVIVKKIEPQKVTLLDNGVLVVLTLNWDDEKDSPQNEPVALPDVKIMLKGFPHD